MEQLLTRGRQEDQLKAISLHVPSSKPNTFPFLSFTGDASSHVTPSWQDLRHSPVIGPLIDFE